VPDVKGAGAGEADPLTSGAATHTMPADQAQNQSVLVKQIW